VARTNYNLAKRQKEAARKARQNERLARRQSRAPEDAPAIEGPAEAPTPATPAPEAAS